MTHIFLHHFLSPLLCFDEHMGVSKNRDTPKSSILIGFSIINHPFWGTPIFGNTSILLQKSPFYWVTRDQRCPKAQARSAGGPPALEQVGSHCPAAG